MRKILACLAIVFSAALPAGAIDLDLGITKVVVSESSVSLEVSLPGGISADVNLGFEQVKRLNLLSLGASVWLVNPNNPALLARLPGGSVPAGFPVLLRIEPPPLGGLSFTGTASLEIHTPNLQYTPGTPLRLFSAPVGGAFRDVTTEMGPGSYRARSNTGGFSEFLIVADTRSVDQVIAIKFDDLEAILEEYEASMPGPVYDDLEERLADAHADYTAGATSAAIQEMDGFLVAVQQASGTDIPNVWRAARDVDNVAGNLRAGAMTLRFSLALKDNPGL
jgi:hypothetical protein